VIVLKGAYLAEAVYHNIGLRTMGDIDLMVKKDHLERVDQLLLAMGCVPKDYTRVVAQDNHHYGYQLPGSGITVEIHWTIISSIIPIQIDMEKVWERAQPVVIAQTPALTMAPEDLLVYLCLHMMVHTTNVISLRMVCDINEVVRHFGKQLNWQVIQERAYQWGVVRGVYLIFRLPQELLGVAVPEDWLVSIRPANFTERYLELAKAHILIDRRGLAPPLKSFYAVSNLSQLWGSKGFRSKLSLIGNPFQLGHPAHVQRVGTDHIHRLFLDQFLWALVLTVTLWWMTAHRPSCSWTPF